MNHGNLCVLTFLNSLNQKIEGNVGIKVSFGGPHEQVLDANLLSELVKKTNGTMFDANGLSGNRWTAEMNLKLAEQNGFGKIGKMQIVSEENYINLPVKNPYVLKYARTGKEFSEYDTLIAVHRVKLHSLPLLVEISKMFPFALETAVVNASFILAEKTKHTITTQSLKL